MYDINVRFSDEEWKVLQNGLVSCFGGVLFWGCDLSKALTGNLRHPDCSLFCEVYAKNHFIIIIYFVQKNGKIQLNKAREY